MKLFLLLSALLAIPLFGVERTQVMMGTFATVSLQDDNGGCADRAFEAMREVDGTLSSYDPHAEIYRLNHERSIAISAMTYDALNKAKKYYAQSNGYFDVTVGSLTRGAYRFGETERVPDTQEKLKAAVGFSLLDFNATHAVLKPGAMVDLGGFGKGYGIDRAAEVFRRCGTEQATVALSGDIRCLGRCRLAVQDPFSEGALMTFETFHDETGISTSGNYRRYVGDKSENHLIDPKTRTSEKAFASVTLIGTCSNSDLDAWTTAASVMPPEEAFAFLKQLPVAYIVIFNDGKIVKSANLSHYINKTEAGHEND